MRGVAAAPRLGFGRCGGGGSCSAPCLVWCGGRLCGKQGEEVVVGWVRVRARVQGFRIRLSDTLLAVEDCTGRAEEVRANSWCGSLFPPLPPLCTSGLPRARALGDVYGLLCRSPRGLEPVCEIWSRGCWV